MKLKLVGVCGVLALAAACERGATDASRGTANQSAPAKGKAEEGRVTVKAPGVDISLNVPEAVRSRMTADADNGLLPPRAQIGGVHVEGTGTEGGSGRNGAVDLTFRSPQAMNEVANWYLAPERAREFSVVSYAYPSGRFVLLGRAAGASNNFNLVLTPRAGGGTEGRITLSDRG